MARTGYRRRSEIFDEIIWDAANRERHYEKHGIDFPLALKFNWSRVLKRTDVEHRDEPPRYNALVALDLVQPPLIFFVVYAKVRGSLKIISIRPANAEEREIFSQLA